MWKCIDKKARKTLAIKKCFDAFRNATDAQRTYREIQYLQQLAGHPNIVRLRNVLKAENDRDIYMVFDFMETDLHAVVRANILEPIHKEYIIYQLIKCLKYMHSAELVHRDIKPANLLLDSNCLVKVCDFGLCRSVGQIQATSSVLTDYVATRWYRAPEILLGSTCYTKAVDIWSVGCILGEMLLGKPIFPGSSTMNQLDKILEITGLPTQEDIASIKSPFAATMLDSLPSPKVKKMAELFPRADANALDLIKKCLYFNPSKRITATDCLSHPYCARFHDKENEINAPAPISIPIDDNKKYKATDYREKLYTEIKQAKAAALAKRRQNAGNAAAANGATGKAATAKAN